MNTSRGFIVSLFAHQMQRHAAAMARGPVLENVDALPCSERQPSLFHRNGKLRQRESRADVRRHVVRPFDGVTVQSDCPPTPAG